MSERPLVLDANTFEDSAFKLKGRELHEVIIVNYDDTQDSHRRLRGLAELATAPLEGLVFCRGSQRKA